MTRNPALENACQIVADCVGIMRIGTGPDPEVIRLAKVVGMADQLLTRPRAVAKEITLYLDDLVANP